MQLPPRAADAGVEAATSATLASEAEAHAALPIAGQGMAWAAAQAQGGSSSAAAPGDDVLEEGLECAYTDAQSGQTCTVRIIKVHHDDPPAYYSIRMPDGNDRETVRERLSHQLGPAAAAEGLAEHAAAAVAPPPPQLNEEQRSRRKEGVKRALTALLKGVTTAVLEEVAARALAKHSAAQHSAAQHSAALHSAAQHSAAQPPQPPLLLLAAPPPAAATARANGAAPRGGTNGHGAGSSGGMALPGLGDYDSDSDTPF